MDVAEHAVLAGLGIRLARDADVQHRGARLHVGGLHDVLDARRRDDDVRLAQVLPEVGRAGVGQRDGRVVLAPGEEQPDRAADRDAAPDDDDVLARQVVAVADEQLDDAARRARAAAS